MAEEDTAPQREASRSPRAAWNSSDGLWTQENGRAESWTSGSWNERGSNSDADGWEVRDDSSNKWQVSTWQENWSDSLKEDYHWADGVEPSEVWFIDKHDLVLSPSKSEDHRFTLVLLHSCSGGPDDFLPFFHRFDASFRGCVRLVVPCAPVRSEDHGHWKGEQNSWFEYDGNALKHPSQLQEQRHRLLKLLHDERTRLPDADARRLVLGGLSQGVAIAIDVALHAPFVVGGVLALRGSALSESLEDLPKRSPETLPLRVLAHHGAYDRQCTAEEARDSYKALLGHGVQVSFAVDGSLGHACARGRQQLCGLELQRINAFLKSTWGDLDPDQAS